MVAWVVGSVEVLQVLSTEFDLSGGFWLWVNGLNFEAIGYGIVGVFVVSWVVSMAYWRLHGFEKRYSGSIPGPHVTAASINAAT
jgi:nickel/cobalt transporter (NiCoT) family protein